MDVHYVMLTVTGLLSNTVSSSAVQQSCTNTISSVYNIGTECTAEHISEALKIREEGCKPRAVLMSLPWPNKTAVDQMTPSSILVDQCDGPCSQLGHSCAPLKTRTRRIPVIFSKCGIDSGTCDKDCGHIDVEEHVSCSCSCSLRPSDCGPRHSLRTDVCSCQCANSLDRETCLDSGQLWDDISCQCGCDPNQKCPEAFVFKRESCSCVALVPAVAVKDMSSSNNEETLTLDIVLMVILLVVIFILLISVIFLTIKTRNLRRCLITARMKVSQTSATMKAGYDDTVEDTEFREIYHQQQQTNLNTSSSGGSSSEENGFVHCSTPSSGFYSEIGHNEADLQQLYHTPQQVRLKKHSQASYSCSDPQRKLTLPYRDHSTAGSYSPDVHRNMYTCTRSPKLHPLDYNAVTLPIEEAIQRIQQTKDQ